MSETQTAAENLLDALNAYSGDNIWQDVIVGHPAYSEARTDTLDRGDGTRVVTGDGSVLTLDQSSGEWFAIWR